MPGTNRTLTMLAPEAAWVVSQPIGMVPAANVPPIALRPAPLPVFTTDPRLDLPCLCQFSTARDVGSETGRDRISIECMKLKSAVTN
jgi:hypothetical protein